jgi:hypothetical protein
VPDEKDLRHAFDAPQSTPTIDPRSVIARSRARRLPRQLAAGGVGLVAVVGIAVLGIQVVKAPTVATVAGSAAVSSEAAAGDAPKRAPATLINLCGGPLASAPASVSGLVATVMFPDVASADSERIDGEVLLTNTGQFRVRGTTSSSPTITLSQDGIVLWHSNGAVDQSAVVVDLEPGESLEYRVSFTPLRCEPADESQPTFPPTLPSVPPGDYDLSAAIDFTPDASMAQDGVTSVDLVTGPIAVVTLQ